jgi:hypothetical protein
MMRTFCGNQTEHAYHDHVDPVQYTLTQAKTFCPGWPSYEIERVAQAIAEAVDGVTIDEWPTMSVDYRLEFIDGANAAASFCPYMS